MVMNIQLVHIQGSKLLCQFYFSCVLAFSSYSPKFLLNLVTSHCSGGGTAASLGRAIFAGVGFGLNELAESLE